MKRGLTICVALLAGAGAATADNWPAWRGADGSGRSAEKDLLTEWDTEKNVRWKVKLPSPGNSTPAVWGDKIFLTQSIDRKGTRRAVLCLDRATGNTLWQQETEFKGKEPTHGDNPYCSASPVTDGERVVASHGSAGLVCYDMGGKLLWKYDVGPLLHVWGNASSPILYGDLAIFWCGPGERQFLLALDKRTGKEVWKHDEPGGDFGKDPKDWRGSWSTPVIVKAGGREELVVNVPYKVKGFDPKTGKELWHCDGAGPLQYTSPVPGPDGVVVVLSGYGGPALAVRCGGDGDVTKTHRLWHHTKGISQRIGSGVVVGEHFYFLQEDGRAFCYEVKSGNTIWQAKLPGKSWSNMVEAGGRIYVTNFQGDCHVIAAEPKFRKIATNNVGEKILASAAVSDGEIFIRSWERLWCVGGKK
jgi:outer membrane protein assembly factor BamB